jgi:hypothetical protein
VNTEQAIGWFESGMWPQDITTTMAVGMALAALRAQQEKENPKLCEYCRADSFPKLLIEGGEQSIWFNADTGKFRESTFYGDGDMDWAHCPMCGRKLEPKEAR